MQGLLYYILYGVIYAISLLPLRLLYLLSDVLFYLMYHVGRYRRRLVKKNLADSFPDKSADELHRIERAYYSWLCDYFVETVKMLSISETEMKKRMHFEGYEQIAKSFSEGRPCSLYLGHYCNWEWVTSLPLHLKVGQCAQIYHPIENADFDRVFLRLRGRFGARSIAMDDTFRTIMEWKKSGTMNVVGYIADQVPGLNNVHCFVDFLNHDTPVFTGAERIARLTESDVYYADITRPKRGYYVCKIRPITLPPGGYETFFFTKQYFKMLEESIQRSPQYWLWSHNRWKRTREEFDRMYTPEEQKKRLSHL